MTLVRTHVVYKVTVCGAMIAAKKEYKVAYCVTRETFDVGLWQPVSIAGVLCSK